MNMQYRLSEIMDIIGGGTPKTSVPNYWNGNIPWLSVKDFNDDRRYVYTAEKSITEEGLKHSSTTLLQRDDIIISARGTVGELAMIPYPMAFNQSCYGLRAKPEIVESEFLYYLLKYNVRLLKNNVHGTVFDTITRDTFHCIEVNVPDKSVQKQISELLCALDDKIELNTRINENLSQQAQAIFNKNFLIGESLPVGWYKSNLSSIAHYLNGLAMQKYRPIAGETGLPVLKIKELRHGMTDSSSERCTADIKPEYIVHDGDIIFSWSGSLLVDFWCGGDCGLNQHLFKVTSTQFDKWFIYAWTNYYLHHFIAVAADKATTMGHIKRDELDKAEVIVPSSGDYMEISAFMQPLYDSIISNRIESRKLSELRDTLLPRLMSGELYP